MAKLWVHLDGLETRPLTLRVGLNSVGRSVDCNFPLEHSSVSSRHCEFILGSDGVLVRDCNSTNGTFVDGVLIKEALLRPGQTVHLGEVKLMVETAEINISIPRPQQHCAVRADLALPALPVGALACAHHLQLPANYECTQCHQALCQKCVRSLKRKGGAALIFCARCNGKCQRIDIIAKKKTFMETVRDTVAVPFTAISGRFSLKK